jgi:TRAP-type C4-dicarboxylate transport system permease small subunit|tara:strand:- start:6772 stop:7356 length:585 start_codon:yes stop_codon:yes gene_type:complete
MKARLEQFLGTVFGLVFLGLAVVVTVETVTRKLFNVSLQGADELGGYALAVGATFGFSIALLGRTHVRVDVLHDKLPTWVQGGLNWLSAISLAALALLLAYLAWFVIQDTQAYKSVAQTPWATPLVIPQTAWLVGLIIFAVIALGSAIYATSLLLKGQLHLLDRDFGPRSTKNDVADELDDIRARGLTKMEANQ